MKPKFDTTESGLEIVDPIERCRCRLECPTPITANQVSDNRIPYPMDASIEITTDRFTVLKSNTVYVRDLNGALVSKVVLHEELTFPCEEYLLEISGPLKVYIYVNSPMKIQSTSDEIAITFGDPTNIRVSARSYHTRPATTITSTADPVDVMQAVSTFGSALKSTAADRSYPTLRGHPPAIEVGDQLNIPSGLDRPDTGISIEVPETLRHVFTVTPLAFYLSANIIPGSKPKLITEEGSTHSLNESGTFEESVSRIMKQIFLFDSIVRTEGETPIRLVEREELESIIEADITRVHGLPLSVRLDSYLAVPFSTIRPHIPEWWPEARIEAGPKQIEFLPFIAKDLATVNTAKGKNDRADSATDRETQDTATTQNNSFHSENPSRSAEKNLGSISSYTTIEEVWDNGDGRKITGTKTLTACRNNIQQSPRDGPLEIKVICNDSDMSEELVTVNSLYGDRQDLPFDITIHRNLTTTDLKNVLSQESDFVHYIGHIDTDGFRCTDGSFDATHLDSIGVKAFFLNACQSFEQGLKLIDAGAIGGIVTLTEIQNSDAVEAGCTIAELLNYGLPLYGALNVLQTISSSITDYHIVGDSTLTVTQTKEGAPITCELVNSGEENELTINSYISSDPGIGGVYTPYISTTDQYHLIPRKICYSSISNELLGDFFNSKKHPLIIDSEFDWTSNMNVRKL